MCECVVTCAAVPYFGLSVVWLCVDAIWTDSLEGFPLPWAMFGFRFACCSEQHAALPKQWFAMMFEHVAPFPWFRGVNVQPFVTHDFVQTPALPWEGEGYCACQWDGPTLAMMSTVGRPNAAERTRRRGMSIHAVCACTHSDLHTHI